MNETPTPLTDAQPIDRLFRYLDFVRSDAPRNAIDPYSHEGSYSFEDLRKIRDFARDIERQLTASLANEAALREALKESKERYSSATQNPCECQTGNEGSCAFCDAWISVDKWIDSILSTPSPGAALLEENARLKHELMVAKASEAFNAQYAREYELDCNAHRETINHIIKVSGWDGIDGLPSFVENLRNERDTIAAENAELKAKLDEVRRDRIHLENLNGRGIQDIMDLREKLAEAVRERDEALQMVDAKCSHLANINDTLRSRGFDSTFGQTDERVIALAKSRDEAILDADSLRAQRATAQADTELLDHLERNHIWFAELLHHLGWKAPSDAQWEHFKAMLKSIRFALRSAIDAAREAR